MGREPWEVYVEIVIMIVVIYVALYSEQISYSSYRTSVVQSSAGYMFYACHAHFQFAAFMPSMNRISISSASSCAHFI